MTRAVTKLEFCLKEKKLDKRSILRFWISILKFLFAFAVNLYFDIVQCDTIDARKNGFKRNTEAISQYRVSLGKQYA